MPTRSRSKKIRYTAATWADADNGVMMIADAQLVRVPRAPLAASACVRLALRCVPRAEDRPRRAIEVAEAVARGEAGAAALLDAAAVDAYEAADYRHGEPASAAALAAGRVANFVAHPSTASYTLADVANGARAALEWTVADVTPEALRDVVRGEISRAMADRVRDHIPVAMFAALC